MGNKKSVDEMQCFCRNPKKELVLMATVKIVGYNRKANNLFHHANAAVHCYEVFDGREKPPCLVM